MLLATTLGELWNLDPMVCLTWMFLTPLGAMKVLEVVGAWFYPIKSQPKETQP